MRYSAAPSEKMMKIEAKMLQTNPVAPSQTTVRGTVLVADDDPLIVELYATALTNAGWSTITACNGLEVLKIVDTQPVDALILDLGMPEVDGYDVCWELCRRNSNLPVLVITGGIVDMERLNLWNVVRTLQKPVGLDELLEFVDGILPPRIP